ncbi:MAG: hypothetical protein AB7V42_06675 [Thermoleophilia bacterium]
MTTAPPPDPFAPYRLAYDQAVENWAKTMQDVVGTDEFASVSAEFLRRYVEFQEALRTASRTSAESLHLPTADDLARIAQLVVNVERKVDEVSDQTHAAAAKVAEAAPAEALASIADRLTAIEATLAELAARPVPAPVAAPAPAAEAAPVAEAAPAPRARRARATTAGEDAPAAARTTTRRRRTTPAADKS